MIRGICKCCNRTAPLTDLINFWCDRCASDPILRQRIGNYKITRFITFVVIGVILIALAGLLK